MKKILSILLCTSILAFNGCGVSDSFKAGYDSETKYVGINLDKIKEIPVTNATGEELGKRAEVTYNADKVTDESLKNFYNDKIKDKDYNYFSLVNEKDKKHGIVSPGCLNILSYGEIDETGSIVKSEKDITID